jgi:hypothetical protein
MTNLKYQTEHLLEKHIKPLIALRYGQSRKQPLLSGEIKIISAALKTLQRGLTGDRTLAGAGYMNTPEYRNAYLLYYWPVSYIQISYAASFAEKKLVSLGEKAAQEHRPLRILDLGSGPGPASCALTDIFAEKKLQLPDITMTDTSSEVLHLAQQIMGTEYPSISVTTIKNDFQLNDKNNNQTGGKPYDIIIMSHALNELWKDHVDAIERRMEFLNQQTTHLSSDGILFLIEPALLETSRNLLTIRDRFMQEGWHTIAPCTGSGQCPALSAGPGHTCHAHLNWIPPEPVASLAKNAGLDRDAVKMTFCILQRQQPAAAAGTEGLTVSGRIVSEGMLNKAGRIRFLICNGEQRIPISAKKDDPHAKTEGFFSLQRYDYVTIENPEQRGDSSARTLGFGNQSRLYTQKN